jgi:hypothetical protein
VCEGRLLREDATLWEAGVRAEGVVELRVGEAGGMPGAEAVSMFAREARERWEQLANDVEGLEGAVWRLEAVRQAIDGPGLPSASQVPAGQERSSSPDAIRLHMVELVLHERACLLLCDGLGRRACDCFVWCVARGSGRARTRGSWRGSCATRTARWLQGELESGA